LISWWWWWFFFLSFWQSFSPVGKFVLKLAKSEFFEFYSYKVLKKIKRFLKLQGST
jgi:hypothetical protein